MSERKAVIKNADMSEDMQQDAVDCASQALEKYNIEKASSVCRGGTAGDRSIDLRYDACECDIGLEHIPAMECVHTPLPTPPPQ